MFDLLPIGNDPISLMSPSRYAQPSITAAVRQGHHSHWVHLINLTKNVAEEILHLLFLQTIINSENGRGDPDTSFFLPK